MERTWGQRYTELFKIQCLTLNIKDNNRYTCANSKLLSCLSKTVLVLHYNSTIIVENNYCVFLPHADSIPSLAKVENETMPNLD